MKSKPPAANDAAQALADPPAPPVPADPQAPPVPADPPAKPPASTPIVSTAPPPFTGQGKPVITNAMAAAAAKETVRMVFPRGFSITLPDGSAIRFERGTHAVPTEVEIVRNGKPETVNIAKHWYLEAQGVKPV